MTDRLTAEELDDLIEYLSLLRWPDAWPTLPVTLIKLNAQRLSLVRKNDSEQK